MKAAAKKPVTKRQKAAVGRARVARVDDVALPVRLTHPEKILDTESGVTKEQLARYYWAISPYMLPYIADRPLTLVRCTEGSGKPCFYQKHRNQMLGGSLGSMDVVNQEDRRARAVHHSLHARGAG